MLKSRLGINVRNNCSASSADEGKAGTDECTGVELEELKNGPSPCPVLSRGRTMATGFTVHRNSQVVTNPCGLKCCCLD